MTLNRETDGDEGMAQLSADAALESEPAAQDDDISSDVEEMGTDKDAGAGMVVPDLEEGEVVDLFGDIGRPGGDAVEESEEVGVGFPPQKEALVMPIGVENERWVSWEILDDKILWMEDDEEDVGDGEEKGEEDDIG